MDNGPIRYRDCRNRREAQILFMPLIVNLRLLEQKPQRAVGELPIAEFAEGFTDGLMRFIAPLKHDLEIRKEGAELLVEGRLTTELECDCSRCLKTFRQSLELLDFTALIPLTGEDAIPVGGDFANLTPRLREDSLLALPTAPLCKPDCRGLAAKAPARDARVRDPSGAGPGAVKSPWDALEQLKLK